MVLKLTFIAAAALLTLSAAPADAQSALNPNGPGSQTRCWDASSNQVRSANGGGTAGYQGGSSAPPPIGTPSRTLGHIPLSPSAPGGIATRPPEAATLPNC